MSNKKNNKRKIGTDEIVSAYKTMMEYKDSKRDLENRIISNEKWFKLRCNIDGENGIGKSSAWLFNSIINKHADAMDSFPEPNVLPREPGDTESAKQLSSILPAILEKCNFEQVYSDVWWYKLKTGTGVYGVFWNNDLEGGLGDIDIRQLDILNLFWEPGIKYIDQSANLFYAVACEKEKLKEEYPHIKFDFEGDNNELEAYDLESELADETKALVVDWYYKKKVGGKTVLHYCKFVGKNLLYASENDEKFSQTGFYSHGKYPVVFDTMFVSEGTPAGFGYIDVMKGCQNVIDKLDAAIVKNTLISETPRWFISDTAGINEEEYADWTKAFVHTTGRIDDETLKQVSVEGISEAALKLLQFKVDELKENSGNRDFSQGSTSLGVTAASAIIALQEAGGKLSRDMVKSSFRAYASLCYLMIELIRQFYTEPRTFRITGSGKNYDFIVYNRFRDGGDLDNGEFSSENSARPIYDIKIVPQKQNPFQKATQNELAKELFNLGMFDKDRREEAIIAVRMMDFNGKEEVLAKLKEE